MARILVIEDNNDIHAILTSLFEKEHEVYSAYSGTEGLAVFEREKPDLVLLDIMLPGKNGDQVLKEIRRTNSQVPILMLTAQLDCHSGKDLIQIKGLDNIVIG